MNVAPSPGVDSIHTLPSCASAIFLTIARPTPVPGEVASSRWKILKICSAYLGSIPGPLSATSRTTRSPRSSQLIWISGTPVSGRPYFRAFWIRFWRTCLMRSSSP